MLIPSTPVTMPPRIRQAEVQCALTNVGARITQGTLTKTLTFFGPSIVHVNTNLGVSYSEHPSLAVIAKPKAISLSMKTTSGAFLIRSGELVLSVNRENGAITFLRRDGTLLTQESPSKAAEVKKVTLQDAPTYEVQQTFALRPDESLYGLGQYNQPYMDYRGQNVLMVQTNVGIVVPFLCSTRRYGILWDIYSKSKFSDDPSGASFWAESAPAGIDYYFVAGQTMDGVISGYRHLTGAAPMYPRAAFGLFMSKERYQSQDQLLDIARTFRREHYPMDYMVQDWQYWGSDHDGYWSGMIWDKTRYPNPAAMTKTLHERLHSKLMISIWPSIGNDTDLSRELDANHLLFNQPHWISKQARVYDAYSEKGRQIYFKHIKKGLLDVGIDALWMDGTEVEVGTACHNPAEVEHDIKGLGKNAMGDFTRYLNPYSLLTTKGTYEGQRKTSNQRVLTLTRSAWAGQQRYGAMPWSGDTTASWGTLRAQISGGINVAMAGLPYWTQDTGGFFVNYPGGTGNGEYRELFDRWHQFAIFNPVYRIHGTNIDREPYRFKGIDPEVYQGLQTATALRYRMLPYLYSLGWQSSAYGYTMMRGLPMDFPDDRAVRKTDDAFMFGPAFLVHPVTRAIYRASAPAPATVPVSVLQTTDGKPGLTLQYFEGRNFDRLASEMIDTKIDHEWPRPPLADIPAGLKSLDNFSARWKGNLVAPEDGEYEIGLEGDDGYRLWLNDKMVVEDWSEAAKRYKGTRVTLQKGDVVPVRIDYYQDARDRNLRFAWRSPSELKKIAEATAKLDNVSRTYLPTGTTWYDFWTNKKLGGGLNVDMACPLDRFPIYVRAGSILPLGPSVQYATEKLKDPYEIRIYPGANGKFEIYEDDNETYNYELGKKATIPLTWDEKKQRLTIGTRQGSFPGMVQKRDYRIVWARPGYAAGVQSEATADVVVHYTGKAVRVQRPRR